MLSPGSFLEALVTRCNYTAGEPVLAGVSGGVDSVVLADLLFKNKIPFVIAHVNFGLRGAESDADEKFVCGLAEKMNVPFYLKKVSEKDFENSGENSVQAAARNIRYDFFRYCIMANGISKIAVAHHADDNIETVLLNFARGTSLRGLTGMHPVFGNIIRPLLGFSRAEIETYAQTFGLKWREDSSNATDHYTRNKFRHHLLPWLQEGIPQGFQGFETSMKKLAEAEELIEAALANWEKENCKTEGKQIEIYFKPGDEIFLRAYLRQKGFNDGILKSLDAVVHGEVGKQIQSRTWRLVRERGFLALIPAGHDPNAGMRLVIRTENCTGRNRTELISTPSTAVIDAETLQGGLALRPWKAGDAFIPFAEKGKYKVSDILTNMKLPHHEKENACVVVSGDEIVWLPGYRIADKFRVSGKTKTCLVLSVVKPDEDA